MKACLRLCDVQPFFLRRATLVNIKLEWATKYKNNNNTILSKLSQEDVLGLRDIVMQIVTVFGSIYLCKQKFLRMKQTKSVHRSRLTDEHV